MAKVAISLFLRILFQNRPLKLATANREKGECSIASASAEMLQLLHKHLPHFLSFPLRQYMPAWVKLLF